jgi:hypothetical protein
MKIKKKDIQSLVFALCKFVHYRKVLKFKIKGMVAEGVFDDDGTDREFRILLTFENDCYCGIMATVEYGLIIRTYAQIAKEKWEAL